jgi:DNA end-binding protein Ku
LKAAAPGRSGAIEISDFVDLAQIDPLYFRQSYYLAPKGKGADRAYALLREAIRDSERIGIAKIILRDTQHLAALEAIGDALVLTMMRFSDELADLGDFSFPKKTEIRAAELKMARQLVDSLASEWDPEKYTDEYRDNLMRVINAKIKGKAPKLREMQGTPQGADVVDLMARLRASLEGRKSSRAGTSKKPAASKHRKSTGRKKSAA